jgi:hypothetical protein
VPIERVMREVLANNALGPAVQAIGSQLSTQNPNLGPDLTAKVLETLSVTAFCSLRNNRYVIVGQDRAPLINWLWSALHARNGKKPTRPAGIILPLMPFGESHPLAGDSLETLQGKLTTALRRFRSYDEQVNWAADLLRLTVGLGPVGAEAIARIAHAPDCETLARNLAGVVHAWSRQVSALLGGVDALGTNPE